MIIESYSLRQQVIAAEKFRRPFPEICEICPFFAIIPQQTGAQRTDCSAENGILSRLFSARHMRSPVSSRDKANAMRSEAGNLAIARLTFLASWKAIPVRPISRFSGQFPSFRLAGVSC
jgi:hypothetical protein